MLDQEVRDQEVVRSGHYAQVRLSALTTLAAAGCAGS
jgi:hypothetical protein